MSNVHDVKSRILTLLEQKHPIPELGARLKQHLNRSLKHDGLPSFNEKPFGYKKFADFLAEELKGQVIIERPNSSGDVSISLPASHHPTISQTSSKLPSIKSQIWQAFTNPDAGRSRFYRKSDGKIVHYLAGTDSAQEEVITQQPSNYIQIPPIPETTQVQWMREFLAATDLDQASRAYCAQLLDEKYSSSVNLDFTRRLGEHAKDWAKQRTLKVTAVIEEWAAANAVPFALLLNTSGTLTPTAKQETKPDTNKPSEKRVQLHKAASLLELLDEEDIKSVVIPTLLSTLLIKSRM
ncbi:hypothetical protein LL270_10700 [Pseudomonas aestusnigri]|uniref:hypothetical protein n=1 Tax=Halopseudomonas aestusnigri TaxID=857252 RepID=UPI001D17E93E|nr:hypothetical protein [Halopseudomonas aestusnigri]MCC4261123.1 hypothetical protein [Halopseudomonas aestusnigri]